MKESPTTIQNTDGFAQAAEVYRRAKRAVALTGAGISVESGIPDFRSPGGLWTVFSPDKYATLDVFLRDTPKAWKLYRALGQSLEGKDPNPGHLALARLENEGRLASVITQNVDSLHQKAGSKQVIEIHGDHRRLQCIKCGNLEGIPEGILKSEDIPSCGRCDYPLKPNVVLFGEGVRDMDRIQEVIETCDALIVTGTSAEVYPAAGLPAIVHENGGKVFEFNVEETNLTRGGLLSQAVTDYFFPGKAGDTLPEFVNAVLRQS
ncbi:NAD-dependent deacetylase [Acidobacteriota bacterium]